LRESTSKRRGRPGNLRPETMTENIPENGTKR
jgi:hypothetical protein